MYVVIGFGAVHLGALTKLGEIQSLPAGMAHYLEHLLFWLSFDEHLIPIEKKHYVTPNAVVSHNQSIWYAQHVFFERNTGLDVVCDLVRDLLMSVIVSARRRARVEQELERTLSDVLMEMRYRHGNGRYRQQLDLMSAMYREHPVRIDILGTKESLSTITRDHVDVGLDLIRSNVNSINVIGTGLPTKLMERVRETVGEVLSRDSRPSFLPLIPHDEGIEPARRLSKATKSGRSSTADAFVGVKLKPFSEETPESTPKVLERFVASQLPHLHVIRSAAFNQINWPHARAYWSSRMVSDPFYFLDPEQRRQVVDLVTSSIETSFTRVRSFLEDDERSRVKQSFVEPLFSYEGEATLMKVISAADLFGWDLSDVMNAIGAVSPEHLDALIAELRSGEASSVLVYDSPYADLLEH